MKKFLLTFLLLLLPVSAFAGTLTKGTLTKVTDKQCYKTVLGEANDEVIIGDSKSSVFVPQIKFSKWQNECSLTIKAPDIFASTTPTLTDKLEIGDSKIGFYFNPDPDNQEQFKFGIIWNEKPTSNNWSAKLEGWEEFNFDYKEPWLDKDGNEIYERVVNGFQKGRKVGTHGGYEIWHKTKRDHIIGQTNYMFGMIGFLYRPIFVDATGKKVNGLLNIKDGIYTVSCPQEFIDDPKTVYPIKANDTFGNEGAPQDYTTLIVDNAELGKYTLGFDGDVSKLTAYMDASATTKNAKGIIYDDNGVGGRPSSWKATSGVTAVTTTAGYFDLTFSSSVSLTAGNWWLGIIIFTNSIMFSERSSGGVAEANGSDDYASPSNPWGGSSFGTINPCIYATYTAGGGAVKTINGLVWSSVSTINGTAKASIKTLNGATAN